MNMKYLQSLQSTGDEAAKMVKEKQENDNGDNDDDKIAPFHFLPFFFFIFSSI